MYWSYTGRTKAASCIKAANGKQNFPVRLLCMRATYCCAVGEVRLNECGWGGNFTDQKKDQTDQKSGTGDNFWRI